jgi:class 3 adenylate cyclase
MMRTVRRDLPTRTVTFLFTDVEGSTRLLHELGAERYAAVLAEHRGVVREAFAAEGGVEVDTQGAPSSWRFRPRRARRAARGRGDPGRPRGRADLAAVGLHTGTRQRMHPSRV